MKRRTFLTGLLVSTVLSGITLKSEAITTIKPKAEEEQFYEFFERFNGFPINSYQKEIYQRFTSSDMKHVTGPRQMGATTLLITFAAWQNEKNKRVVYYSMSELMSKYVKKLYYSNYNNLGKIPNEKLFVIQPSSCRGYNNDTIFIEDNTVYRLYMNHDERFDGIEVYKNRFRITTV
jgi:hypothetical protein